MYLKARSLQPESVFSESGFFAAVIGVHHSETIDAERGRSAILSILGMGGRDRSSAVRESCAVLPFLDNNQRHGTDSDRTLRASI